MQMSHIKGRDRQTFDMDAYKDRVARYIDPFKEENRIFFEALDFAHELHQGQIRKSGAPYISHPCSVVEILVRELGFRDPILLSAALLHDVVEDVPSIKLHDIAERFGPAVAELVDGCTKLARSHLDRASLKDLTHSKIFLTASRRLGVLIIKLSDRLHNLRTLHFLPMSKRQRIAQETLEVYAPIAGRFNMFSLKRELYHLALSFLYPRKSKKILQQIKEARNSVQVIEIEQKLQAAFEKAGYRVTIRARPKGLGSYYDPLKRTLDPDFPENYVDFAVILDTQDVVACYSALGVVCTTFPPIPRTIRDFIANPKSNGYQSLHVRIHVKGQNFLVKIRTPEMDYWAAYGILGEWDSQNPMTDEHWQEVSELLRTIGEYGGAGVQRKALIKLSAAEEIFVYSPLGDIYFLPKDSIVLDFAYKIHSDLGDHCEGAMVNNEWADPMQTLKDGDTVEIMTSTEPVDVDPDLETLCKTPKARTAINRQLQKKRSHHALDLGRQILSQALGRCGLSLDVLHGENARLMLELLNVKDLSDLLIRIGQDILSPELILYYLASPAQEREKSQKTPESRVQEKHRHHISIQALDRAIHKFARCCDPFPGQDHLVATLSERGITLHRDSCSDIRERYSLEPQQLFDVIWDKSTTWPHIMEFHIQVRQETLSSLLPRLSSVSNFLEISRMESFRGRHDQPHANIIVNLRSYEEAAQLFSVLPKGRITVEHYARKAEIKADLRQSAEASDG